MGTDVGCIDGFLHLVPNHLVSGSMLNLVQQAAPISMGETLTTSLLHLDLKHSHLAELLGMLWDWSVKPAFTWLSYSSIPQH